MCAVKWYSLVTNYDWAEPKSTPRLSPFTQLIWKASKYVGIGLVRANGNATVVAYFDPPQNDNSIKENIPPVTGIHNLFILFVYQFIHSFIYSFIQ